MSSLRPFFISALLSLPVATALHAEVKIVTVDINRVINELPEGIAKRQQLDTRAAAAQKKIDDQRSELLALEKRAKASKDQGEAEKLRNGARDLERMVRDTDEELRREFLRTNQVLAKKALDAVEGYARAQKIDLVMNKSDSGLGGVLFGAKSADITTTIIQQQRK